MSVPRRQVWRLSIRHVVLTFGLLVAFVRRGEAQGAREAGLDVFGLSWHYRSATYVDSVGTHPYQQRNLGAGVHVRLGGRGRQVWMLKAGGYEDSMRGQAWYAGPVWQYRLAGGLHAGAGVLAFQSESYTQPVVPLPLVTYRAGRLGLNMTWMPPGDPAMSGALAFFGTLVMWRAP